MLRYLCSRALLILLSLGVCAGRLHAHGAPTPLGVQQELNCCLTLVRIAATRRSAPPEVRRVRAPRLRTPFACTFPDVPSSSRSWRRSAST